MGLYLSGIFALVDCDDFNDEVMEHNYYNKRKIGNKKFIDCECPEDSPNGWGFFEDISIYE